MIVIMYTKSQNMILQEENEKNSLSFEAETILVQINGKEDLYAT